MQSVSKVPSSLKNQTPDIPYLRESDLQARLDEFSAQFEVTVMEKVDKRIEGFDDQMSQVTTLLKKMTIGQMRGKADERKKDENKIKDYCLSIEVFYKILQVLKCNFRLDNNLMISRTKVEELRAQRLELAKAAALDLQASVRLQSSLTESTKKQLLSALEDEDHFATTPLGGITVGTAIHSPSPPENPPSSLSKLEASLTSPQHDLAKQKLNFSVPKNRGQDPASSLDRNMPKLTSKHQIKMVRQSGSKTNALSDQESIMNLTQRKPNQRYPN